MTWSYEAVAELEEVPNLLPTVDVEPKCLILSMAYKRLVSQPALGANSKFLVFDEEHRLRVEEPFESVGKDTPSWLDEEPPWRVDSYMRWLWKEQIALPAGKYSGVALVDGRRSRFVHFEATESGFPAEPVVRLDFFSARPLEARVGGPGEFDFLLRIQFPPGQEALELANVGTPLTKNCVLCLDGNEYPRDLPPIFCNHSFQPGSGDVLSHWCSLDDFHIPYVPGEHRVSLSLKDVKGGGVFARSAEQVIYF